MDVLDERIRDLGGSLSDNRRGVVILGRRARNKQTLVKTFRVQVNVALIKRKDLFRRVGRGQFTAL